MKGMVILFVYYSLLLDKRKNEGLLYFIISNTYLINY